MNSLRAFQSGPVRKGLTALLVAGLSGLALADRVPVPNVPITVDLPKTMRQLNATQLASTFGNTTQAAFTTDDQKVLVSFQWRNSTLLPSDLSKLETDFAKVIQAKNPKSFTHRLTSINGSPWAQFVFVTAGKKGDVRNELLVTSAAGRTLVVTVNATASDYLKDQAAAQGITGSLRLQ